MSRSLLPPIVDESRRVLLKLGGPRLRPHHLTHARRGRRTPVSSQRAGAGGAVALLVGALLGCTGRVSSPEGFGADGSGGSGAGSGVSTRAADDRIDARVWRLSPLHYHREVQRLFPGAPTVDLPVSAPENGLTDIPANARVDLGNVRILDDEARAVGRFATEDGGAATRCAAYGTPACADELLAWLPRAAFRRPPSADEAAGLRTLFDELRAAYDFDFAVSGLVRAVLLSPQFLYRSELGDGRAEGGTVLLDDHEIASLMAFAMTDAAPDDALLSAAEAGRLKDPVEREAQARRLMGKSAAMWQRFFWEWLHMSTLDSQGQEVGLEAGVVRELKDEYEAFIENIIVEGRGTLLELLTSTRTWAGPGAAALYGVPHPGGGQAEIALDPNQRSGLLTLGAWLVSHGKRGRANVVRRGMGIYIDAMCTPITVPEDLDLEAETEALVGSDATVQELVEARGNDPTCGACHRIADPVGLAFERFASTGAWQDTYPDGLPVESAVTVSGVGDFDDAVGLSAALAANPTFQRCLVRRLAHYLVGLDVQDRGQQRWTEEALETFQGQDTSFEALLVDLVTDPAFIERSPR